MAETPYLVHVVDDELPVRESLDRLLRPAGYDTRLYEGAGGLLVNLADVRNGCILLDAEMRSMPGLELAEHLHSTGLRLPTIVMMGLCDVRTAVRAMKLGAVNLVEKPFTDKTLLTAVATASAGSRVISDPSSHIAEARAAVATLSGRERQVLTGLVAGQSHKVIAHDLAISSRTVEIHKARMLHRLHTVHLASAIRIAVLAQLGGNV